MLFYIEYGCSVSHERLIVDADNFEKADEYTERAAQDKYYIEKNFTVEKYNCVFTIIRKEMKNDYQ